MGQRRAYTAFLIIGASIALAACQPAGQQPAAPAAPAAAACALAGKWRVASEGGESTWVITEAGAVTNEADTILRGQAELQGNQLSWRWDKGDWSGSHTMTLAPDCQSATGSTQYTRVPRGRELGGTYSTTAVRVNEG